MTDDNTAPPPPEAPSPIDGKRRAAAVLEVLAGVRSPQEAAQQLGLCLPSYYQLEARALQGLVDACGPRKRGRAPSGTPAEADRLRAESLRQQSLIRSMQKTLGLEVPESEDQSGRKRHRRPVVRALRAAHKLRDTSAS
jgi:hypothetical protein